MFKVSVYFIEKSIQIAVFLCMFWVVAARVDPSCEDSTVVVDFRKSGAFFYVASNDLLCVIYFVKICQIAQKLK
jgi:hypothetical protein